MTTRISSGVYVTTLVFLLLIYMIPIDCKLLIFPYICLFPFLKITIIISWHAPSYLISGKPVSQYALYSLIFKQRTARKVSLQSIQPQQKIYGMFDR